MHRLKRAEDFHTFRFDRVSTSDMVFIIDGFLIPTSRDVKINLSGRLPALAMVIITIFTAQS